jgi:hypothetical protein
MLRKQLAADPASFHAASTLLMPLPLATRQRLGRSRR